MQDKLKAKEWPGFKDRLHYQSQFNDFSQAKGKVLDVGCRDMPFKYATTIVDSNPQLAGTFLQDKEIVHGDIQNLPFPAKSYDYIFCSHVLELVDDPLKACQELMRVGKQGYIEVPAMMKDSLFAWAEQENQKWHTVSIANTISFYEYSPRQLKGIQSKAWFNAIYDEYENPLQDAFYNNQDLFNVMFNWQESFNVFVYHLNGKVESFLND